MEKEICGLCSKEILEDKLDNKFYVNIVSCNCHNSKSYHRKFLDKKNNTKPEKNCCEICHKSYSDEGIRITNGFIKMARDHRNLFLSFVGENKSPLRSDITEEQHKKCLYLMYSIYQKHQNC